MPSPTHAVRVLTLIALPVLMAGCSGPTEDVRVKTCKQLAMQLAGVSAEPAWVEHEEDIRENAYAAITVRSKGGGKSALKAVCRYEYDAAEETMETHVDPLSAYATVPYALSLDGRAVAPKALTQAMTALQLQAGKRLLEKARHSLQ